MANNVLVIGGGGREHALAWKLAHSPSVKHVYISPGNAGTQSDISGKISNTALDIKSHENVAKWCTNNNINLVVVGPEDPLANGIADDLQKAGIKCFGPCKKAAQIEASKEFAKSFMDQYKIPTARWKSFTNAEDAKNHILSAPYSALVVKASGLAAGKGVIVAGSKEEAVEAVDKLKQDKGLSAASETIVIEELLEGEEVSVLCFSDGTNISVMPPAQDHKRLLENDEGPNTGGMGAYCRCPQVSEKDIKFIETNILQRAIAGMRSSGYPYVGVLYAGLMMTKEGPKVLEFNCRFGDPETQVILPLLESDLCEVALACATGKLDTLQVKWSKDKYAVGVVVVSGGYPGSYPKGKVIKGLEKLQYPNYIVFHAGTTLKSNELLTSGGRVLAVISLDTNLKQAAENAQKGAKMVEFEGAFFRKDIAYKALQKSHYGGITYKASGVDIESADKLVDKIKILTKSTKRPEVCGGIGGFGGIFDMKLSGYNDPYLVSRGKGLGAKLKVAQDCHKHEDIGMELVATCVNDIVAQGAEPLFFLDTFTCGKLDVDIASQVVAGIAKACTEAKCALIGGETAEMPGMYANKDYDLIGFARGAVERANLLPKKDKIIVGDVLISLSSLAINASSFNFINKVLEKHNLTYHSPAPFASPRTLGDILLAPSEIYVDSLLPLMKKNIIKAAVNTMEEGLLDSLLKIIPDHLGFTVGGNIPDFFKWIADIEGLNLDELFKIFNNGVNMIVVVSADKKDLALEMLSLKNAAVIGYVVERFQGRSECDVAKIGSLVHKRKVGIITSGAGSNLKSLIEHIQNPDNVSSSEIVAVVSDDATGENVQIAQKSCLPIKFIDTSQTFEQDVHKLFVMYGVEIICCMDSFSKPFTDEFLHYWRGKIIKSYHSILPAFEDCDALKGTTDIKPRITGCTIHFVEPNGAVGAIIDQTAIFMDVNETHETLERKMRKLEQSLFPKALELLASGSICQSSDRKLKCLNPDVPLLSLTMTRKANLRKSIKSIIQSTFRPGFNSDFKTVCGIFDLKASQYTNPYLISGTDGVGTKLKIAQACNIHNTIGIDLVAMCVNDILTHGAEPLFFMSCFNCGHLNNDLILNVFSGISEGCKQANCALLGTEVTEFPDIYTNDDSSLYGVEDYDVVGYSEGAVSHDYLLPKPEIISDGDILIGLPASGAHSNGFSLIRKIVELKNMRYQDPAPFDPKQSLGEALLTPTKIYVSSVLPLLKKGYVKAAAHITGGGLLENIPRILPAGCKVVLDVTQWSVPPVLKWIESEGKLSETEMLRTFNCGLGMVLIVDGKHKDSALQCLKNVGENASCVGRVAVQHEGDERVQVLNWTQPSSYTSKRKKKVGVLISGSGTNLQALIDYTQNPCNLSMAEIVLVLSNVAGVEGLKRAERASIPTMVISHKNYKSRVEFDMVVSEALLASGVEIVCLAGFMRILSKEFVELWQGKLLNVHPAVLPAYKGLHTHKRVLEYGGKIAGCTVHFVEPIVDAGAIIEQAAIRVEDNDTPEILQERVKQLEHKIFPKALELLANQKISRRSDGKLQWHFDC